MKLEELIEKIRGNMDLNKRKLILNRERMAIVGNSFLYSEIERNKIYESNTHFRTMYNQNERFLNDLYKLTEIK